MSYQPIAVSNYKYTFDAESEEPLIRELREWSHEYFAQYCFYSLEYIPPSNGERDFDVLGKVTKTVKTDDLSSTVWFRSYSGQLF